MSVSRSSTSRTRPRRCPSSTSPWTWWRWPTPRRPSRWSATRTTGSPCTSTPPCLTTWRCRQPRGRTLCRARWELPPRLEKIASVQNVELSFSKQSDCWSVKLWHNKGRIYNSRSSSISRLPPQTGITHYPKKTAHFALCLRPAAISFVVVSVHSQKSSLQQLLLLQLLTLTCLGMSFSPSWVLPDWTHKSMLFFLAENVSLWPELPARRSLDRHRGSADRRLQTGHRPHQRGRTSSPSWNQ